MSLWVLITNSSFAEIYCVNRNGKEIKKIHHIDFPKGREKGTDILSDRPGRSFDRMGDGRHALGTTVDLHSHEQKVFARQVIDILKKEKNENRFEHLAIFAPPQFLGEIRAALSDNLKSCVVKEFNKDIPEYLSEQERIDMFCKYLEIEKPVYTPKRT